MITLDYTSRTVLGLTSANFVNGGAYETLNNTVAVSLRVSPLPPISTFTLHNGDIGALTIFYRTTRILIPAGETRTLTAVDADLIAS